MVIFLKRELPEKQTLPMTQWLSCGLSGGHGSTGLSITRSHGAARVRTRAVVRVTQYARNIGFGPRGWQQVDSSLPGGGGKVGLLWHGHALVRVEVGGVAHAIGSDLHAVPVFVYLHVGHGTTVCVNNVDRRAISPTMTGKTGNH